MDPEYLPLLSTATSATRAFDTVYDAGRNITEGDIAITAYGAMLVESTVANAIVAANTH